MAVEGDRIDFIYLFVYLTAVVSKEGPLAVKKDLVP